MIVTERLTKWYGEVRALEDLTMEVRKGEVFGLLGPNGSGKTTTLRLLLGLLRPTAGRASAAGFDCWRQSGSVRRLVSYLPGEVRLFGWMRGLELLKYLSSLRQDSGFDRAVALAERVLDLDLRRKVRTYSTGMKQKLALAQAFADPVDLLILDEPTSSLDPSARATVLGLVAEARSRGQTVIFSGHVLDEVEQVADRVGIMRLGRLRHIEDMHERRSLRMLLLKFRGDVPQAFPDDLELTVRERNGDTVLLEHRGEVTPLLAWLNNQPVADLAIGTDDLKSLYKQFYGPESKDDDSQQLAG